MFADRAFCVKQGERPGRAISGGQSAQWPNRLMRPHFCHVNVRALVLRSLRCSSGVDINARRYKPRMSLNIKMEFPHAESGSKITAACLVVGVPRETVRDVL